jgi:TolB-like protein/DNA-binding winged helix-turn-helix (wHTH) protein/Flp pilus assembly protein TadD
MIGAMLIVARAKIWKKTRKDSEKFGNIFRQVLMPGQNGKRYILGEYEIGAEGRLLSRDGEPVHITNRPFQVLLYLIERRDRVVTRQELLDRFWDGKDVYDDTLRKCIGAIRKALGDRLSGPRFIETYYGEGYRYIGPLEEATVQGVSSVTEVEKTRGVRITIEEEVSDPAPAMQNTGAASAVAARRFSGRAIVMLAIAGVAILATGVALYRSQVASSAKGSTPVTSIAVLPLKNLPDDPSNEYLSEGLTESLITALSRIDGLKVISRSSAFAFKGRAIDLQEVASRLDVGAVLEGSIHRSGDRVRVEVRLVSAENGRVIWASDTYDRSLQDIFILQDDITRGVITGMSLRLGAEGEPRLAKQTSSPEAYEAYLKGRYYWNKRTAEGLKRAIEHFERATRLDHGYALAYCGLADCYNLGVWYIPIPASEAVPKLREAAAKAIELDDQLAEAHIAMSNVHSFEWRWREAEESQRRAIELNPGYATAHHWYALNLALLGRFDVAIAEIKRARELDPLSLVINTDLGWILYLSRRYDEAIEQYRKALELDPQFSLAHFDLALAYSQKGMHEEAAAEMLRASDRGSDYLGGLGYVYARAGRRDEALKALEQLKQLSKRVYAPPYHFAWIYTGLGEKDRALAMLEKVYEEHTQHVVDLKVHPMFDDLRPDPRYQDLLRRIALPD